MRSGEQAALGNDLKEMMDALRIESAVLAGYDWGGRAACIVAALWPERVRGLVTCGGYNMHDVAGSAKPASAEQEHRYWYQYYFHTERGRAGLTENRRGIAKLLWTLWSPNWSFDDATFEASAVAFDNPDFVDVVIHSYRVRYGYCGGRPGARGDRREARRASRRSRCRPSCCRARPRHGAAGGFDRARQAFHRAVPAPHHSARRSQRAAGGAARDRRRRQGTRRQVKPRDCCRAALHKPVNRTYLPIRRQQTERR